MSTAWLVDQLRLLLNDVAIRRNRSDLIAKALRESSVPADLRTGKQKQGFGFYIPVQLRTFNGESPVFEVKTAVLLGPAANLEQAASSLGERVSLLEEGASLDEERSIYMWFPYETTNGNGGLGRPMVVSKKDYDNKTRRARDEKIRGDFMDKVRAQRPSPEGEPRTQMGTPEQVSSPPSPAPKSDPTPNPRPNDPVPTESDQEPPQEVPTPGPRLLMPRPDNDGPVRSDTNHMPVMRREAARPLIALIVDFLRAGDYVYFDPNASRELPAWFRGHANGEGPRAENGAPNDRMGAKHGGPRSGSGQPEHEPGSPNDGTGTSRRGGSGGGVGPRPAIGRIRKIDPARLPQESYPGRIKYQ